MWTDPIRAVVLRELRALRRQVEAYPSDEALWAPLPGVSNPGGVLAHHLTGNLRHFVGVRLGGSGYVRDRPAEFSRRDLARAELVERIDAALGEVEAGFVAAGGMDPASQYPERVAGLGVQLDEFLLHLVAHLGYHLGQVDYHRRAVTGQGAVGAVLLEELPSAQAVEVE